MVGQKACDGIAAIRVDVVVAGITGLAGLGSVMAAVSAGQTLALANKESLVSAGKIVMQTAAENDARILPLDSKHSAIFQCWLGWQGHQSNLRQAASNSIHHVCLTASGGPFRTRPLDQFAGITPEQAVKHPNWDMGRKISVDSATMMNKGLEVIEAALGFRNDEDPEVAMLAQKLASLSPEEFALEVCGIAIDHPLQQQLTEAVAKHQGTLSHK